MSLSSRFSKLSSVKAAPVQASRNVKRNVVATTQKDKRGAGMQKMRGLEAVPASRPVKLVQTGKPNVRIPQKGNGKPGQGGRRAGPEGKKPMGKGRGRQGQGKKGPIKAEDLDHQLGMYLHKAGKGPNPIAAELDDMLDNYKKGAAKAE